METFSIDSLGTDTPDRVKPLVNKYHNKIQEFAKEFVNDCVAENIEYCSAYGFLLTRFVGAITMEYSRSIYSTSEEKSDNGTK